MTKWNSNVYSFNNYLLMLKNNEKKSAKNLNLNQETSNNFLLKTETYEDSKYLNVKLSAFVGLNKVKINQEILQFLTEFEGFLKHLKTKVIHFIISCSQKLFQTIDLDYYLTKIIETDNYDWAARTKKALLSYHSGNLYDAKKEFKIVFAHNPSFPIRKELEAMRII